MVSIIRQRKFVQAVHIAVTFNTKKAKADNFNSHGNISIAIVLKENYWTFSHLMIFSVLVEATHLNIALTHSFVNTALVFNCKLLVSKTITDKGGRIIIVLP